MNKLGTLVLLGALASSAAGCATETAAARVDVEAERNALRATDREWAALAAGRGPVDEIVSYWTEDARVLSPGEEPVVGRDALRAMVEGGFQTPGFSITWEPEEVHVSESGDLGYTTGWNRVTFLNEQGEQVVSRNRYITVWRKEADGRWRCEFDIWNAPPAEQAGA
jgi:ketosteroid isomerase-like protein